MTSLLAPTTADMAPRFFHLRDVEWRDSGNGKDFTFEGSAVMFNTWSEPMWTPRGSFRERIMPNAFKTVLAGSPDVRLLLNHDKNLILARTKAGTLELEETDEALRVWARIARTTYAVDLRLSMERGDIDGMSFAFDCDPARGGDVYWYDDKRSGEVRCDVRSASDLFDVSIATYPAYLETDAAMRHLDRAIGDGLVKPTRADPQGRRYQRCAQVVAETPWAILPSSLDMILTILSERIAGPRVSDEEIRERIGAQRDNEPTFAGTSAVIPLVGPVLSRAGAMSQVSAAKSLDTFREQFRQALADPAVDSIVLDIDSPGGTADMVPEMADEIYTARDAKPIVAVANAMAASAAFWIGTAASEFVVTPSGEVGSVGVYAAHTDLSRRMEQLGIKNTYISAGKHKVEGNPFEPLSEDAQAAIQEGIDTVYADFVAAVARNRGVTEAQVLDETTGFGQGRTVLAREALQRGMVDSVETIDSVLARLNHGAELRARTYGTTGPLKAPSRYATPDLDPTKFETRDALGAALGLIAAPDDPVGSRLSAAPAETDPVDREAEALANAQTATRESAHEERVKTLRLYKEMSDGAHQGNRGGPGSARQVHRSDGRAGHGHPGASRGH